MIDCRNNNLNKITKEITMVITAIKNNHFSKYILIFAVLLCCLAFISCGSSGAARGARTGAAAGAAGGLIWGLIDGDVAGSMAAGAAVGAASGGAAGYISEKQGKKQ
jgi:hypothetical protein